jgi:serine protease Do
VLKTTALQRKRASSGGDLITEMSGKKIADVTSLRNMVAATAPETKVDFKVIRNGTELSITATLSEYQEKKIVKKTEFENALKGVTVQELTPSLRDKLNLPDGLVGVVVTDVGTNSPAQGLLQANDVIQEVDRKRIQSAQEYENIVSKIGKHDTVILLIYRNGGSVYLTIQS